MLEERRQIFRNIHYLLILDTSCEAESSPRNHVTLAEVNLDKINDEKINTAADSIAKFMKTEFKENGCWLQQYPKTHGNANRLTFDEAEGVELFRKKICLKWGERTACLWGGLVVPI